MTRPIATWLVCLGLVAACDDASRTTPASASGAPPPPASGDLLASGPAPRSATATTSPTAAPTTIFVPLPGASASAAIDARWPPAGFVAQKSKLAGFEVFVSNDVSVALKRHHVGVTREGTQGASPCPSIASARDREGVEVMSRGGGDAAPVAGGNTPSWMVYRQRDRFGVIAVHTATPQGGHGTGVSCCLSGTEADAAIMRATLTNAAAKKAVEACLAALTPRSD